MIRRCLFGHMAYRIISDGQMFRAQHRAWWTLWRWCYSTNSVWLTQECAQREIAWLCRPRSVWHEVLG